MTNLIKFVCYAFKHKWFVFIAGLQVGGIPLWRLIIHDWNKFTPTALPAFMNRALNNYYIRDYREWNYACHHHLVHSPHHWQYWRHDFEGDLAFNDEIVINGCLEMPEVFIREMIADWWGAGRSYHGSWDMSDWLIENLPKMKLHPNTRRKIESILLELEIRCFVDIEY